MISFKGGILSIGGKASNEERHRIINYIYEICFCLGQVLYFKSNNAAIHYAGTLLLIAGAGVIIISKLYRSRINKSLLFVWYLLFTVFAEASFLWAYSPEVSALKYVKFMAVILITCFGMVQYVDSKDDLERLLTCYACSAFIVFIIELIGTPFSELNNGYFGSAVSGNNTNFFGFLAMSGAVICFYKAYIKGRLLWYIPMVFLLFGCFISSSRKATIMSVVQIIMIVFLSFNKKHHFLHLFLVLTVSAIIFFLIMTNDFLYNTVGYRIATLLSFVNDEKSVKYGSLQMREALVYYAKTLFKNKPFAGYGMACFSEIMSDRKGLSNKYAHNNYWEILADLGVTGFVIYYWMYAYLLIKLIVSFLTKTFNDLKVLAFTFLIAEFVLEFGVVSSWYILQQNIIAFIFLCAASDTLDDKKFFYINRNVRGE